MYTSGASKNVYRVRSKNCDIKLGIEPGDNTKIWEKQSKRHTKKAGQVWPEGERMRL